ncbi:hypothetical protein vBKpMFBKp34_234 [Klebsiella phage vB_KpM_FBKp34]|nr:hypothetical protein vBKpMFBKp34_234 [Klebsiella phage vB_KpM_FBKp34]
MSRKDFKETTWGAVTEETIKNTETWKAYVDHNGNPTVKRQNLISACLYTLGYDIDSEFKYKEQRFVTVRSSEDNTKGIETSIFTFPVKRGHKLEHSFKNIPLLNFDVGQNTKKINLSEFGLEYYQTAKNKSKKKRTRDQFIDEILNKSNSYNLDIE